MKKDVSYVVCDGKTSGSGTWREKAGQFLYRNKTRIAQAALVCLLAVCVIDVTTADAATSIDPDNISTGLTKIKSLATNIVLGVGIIIAIYGGISTGLGFAQDNPDSQSRGIKFVVGGLIMCAISGIIQWFQ